MTYRRVKAKARERMPVTLDGMQKSVGVVQADAQQGYERSPKRLRAVAADDEILRHVLANVEAFEAGDLARGQLARAAVSEIHAGLRQARAAGSPVPTGFEGLTTPHGTMRAHELIDLVLREFAGVLGLALPDPAEYLSESN